MAKISEKEFNEKYNTYSQEIFNICYGYTHNKLDSEDIMQNVFIKYLNINKTFKDIEHEKYWLIRVTINLCKDFVKSNYYKKVIIDDSAIALTPDNQSCKSSLFYLIMELPKKYKNVIIMHYYNNYSIKEISGILLISISAVKKRLERARTMLKEKMEDLL